MFAHVGAGTILAAFVGGLISFFSPCVAPLAPGYIGYLSSASLRTDAASSEAIASDGSGVIAVRRANPALAPCLLFVGGFSAAFIALGLLSASFGRLLVAYQLVLETIAGIVMIAMGAFLLDLLPRGVTGVLLREARAHVGSARLQRFGAVGPFLLGVVFAAGWTPCIGPVLASILAYVGVSASLSAGALLLTSYSLGFAAPFILIGLGWTKGLISLGWVTRYSRRISIISGVVLIVVGIVYLTGQVSIFATWAQQLNVPGFAK
ncbi:MAG TPA: cytochrome c biogenesis protein CcdA [Ktedonobacterales bacterium]|nr:cytochrome c biogenesis protein CcdA [Ktedonobacterales bacterium]